MRKSRRIEDKEHDLLDNILEQEGVVMEQYASLSAAGVVGGPAHGAGIELTDWEQQAEKDLNEILAENINQEAVDLNIMMSNYFINTYLPSKRMVGSTSSVDSNLPKSELERGGLEHMKYDDFQDKIVNNVA